MTAVALTSVAAVLGVCLAPWPRTPTRRALVLVSVAAAALAVLAAAGLEVDRGVARTAPMLLIVGYSAVAALLVRSGVAATLAERFAFDPLRIFLVASVLTLLSSNDTVILVLGPMAVTSAHPVLSGATLFVGANVSAALLPQASPTNLLVADAAGWSFADYVTATLPTALGMAAVAAVAVWLVSRRARRRRSSVPRTTRRERQVLAFAATTLLVQPLGDAVGASRAVVGIVLLGVVAAAAVLFEVAPTRVMRDAAWLILPVVAVVVTAVDVVAAALGSMSSTAATTALLVLGAGFTDLTAAAAGAVLVESGRLAGPAVIAVVTATAFGSPVGSLSALLLAHEYRARGGARYLRAVFAIATAIAVIAGAAGLLLAATVSR